MALAKTLNKLRQPSSTAAASGNGRSTASHTGSVTGRLLTDRATSHPNSYSATSSNFHYQLPGVIKGPLPAELITRRPTSSVPSKGNSPLFAQQSTTPLHREIKSPESVNTRVSTPFRVPVKSPDGDSHMTNGFSFPNITVDEYPDRFQVKIHKTI